MITIADTLQESAIELDLKADTPASALFEVAALLRENDRVNDWNGLFEELGGTSECVVEEPESALCLPHARTDAVRSMVISAGRSANGILYPKVKKPVRYVFVIGVPEAMAAEYLRIVGALMRILRQDDVEHRLRTCETPTEFLSILADCEMKL